jgi:hypothetical protein
MLGDARTAYSALHEPIVLRKFKLECLGHDLGTPVTRLQDTHTAICAFFCSQFFLKNVRSSSNRAQIRTLCLWSFWQPNRVCEQLPRTNLRSTRVSLDSDSHTTIFLKFDKKLETRLEHLVLGIRARCPSVLLRTSLHKTIGRRMVMRMMR